MDEKEVKELKVIKVKSENSLLFFTRYIFKEHYGKKFKVANHLKLIAGTLEKVASGEIKRLIINIPPRYGKTEIAVKMFIAWGLAKNPKSKFIHLSYSDDLALDNSQFTKEYIESESFQKIWNIQLKKDSKSKKKWYTIQGGGVYATAAGGAVTGFGAGEVKELEDELTNFSGAIIIDDPLKPDDAKSETKRKNVNDRYNNTIRSRVNDRDTPIIVIMQRLHEDDLSGFLLNGGSGEDWHHLKLPALNGNIPLWPEKHSLEELLSLKNSAPYMFAGQMQQEPAPLEGGMIKKDWFEIVDSFPKNIINNLYIDGAYTKDTKNDPSGLMITAFDKKDNTLYVLFKEDKYLEMPELIDEVKQVSRQWDINQRSEVRIEPKASGLSLKQLLKKYTKLNAVEIKGNQVKDGKIGRVEACSPTMRAGRIKLLKGDWNKSFLDQVSMFPNASHDEQVDNLCYAVIDSFNIYKNTSRQTIRYSSKVI